MLSWLHHPLITIQRLRAGLIGVEERGWIKRLALESDEQLSAK